MEYIVREYNHLSSRYLDKIKFLCNKHNLIMPDEGVLILAVDDNDNVIGFINARAVLMIEPMVCENPIVAKKLFDNFLYLNRGIRPIRAFIKSELLPTVKKLKFERVFENNIIVERSE